MIDILIIAIVTLVTGLSCLAIYRSRKSGKKCIGCPDSCACSGTGCNGGCQGKNCVRS